MRVRSKAWQPKALENPKIILQPQELKGNWNQFFDNDKPIYIEIGCGKGRFICENARTYDQINFIAMERVPKIIAYAARLSDLTNSRVTFLVGDAENLLDYFEKGELSRIFLNFSDPWEGRKKWAKRRLTHPNFLKIYRELLTPDGEIHMKTDNRSLFEFSKESFTENQWQLKNLTEDLHNSGISGNIMTEYEERFLGLGQPIYRLEAF